MKRIAAVSVGLVVFVGALHLSNADAGCVSNGDRSVCLPGTGEGPAPKPKISIKDASILEGLVGTPPTGVLGPAPTILEFKVVLNHASDQTVKVDYATSPGSAFEGLLKPVSSPSIALVDYIGKTGTLTFRPGQTSRKVKVDVLPDPYFEEDETLHVTLSNPKKGKIKDGSAIGTILNDDLILPG